MFGGCSSLRSINLSNFDSQKTNNIRNMFKDCSMIKFENVITQDKEIIKELSSFLKYYEKYHPSNK